MLPYSIIFQFIPAEIKIKDLKFIFPSLLLFCFSQVSGQQLTIKLNILATDDAFKKSQAIAPCFHLHGNEIEELGDFGSMENSNLKKTKIKLPLITNATDTAYGFVYFGGAQNPFSKGYIIFIISNNKIRNGTSFSLMWFDKNNNLDLSDDGEPDTLYYYTKYVDVLIPNNKIEHGAYLARLSRFNLNEFSRYKMMLDNHYDKHKGSKTFSGADYSFKETRMNILASDLTLGTDSFRISLKDKNCNGIYNEIGYDQLIVGEYGKVLEREEAEFLKEKNKNYFEWNQKRYQLVSIKPNGSSIELKLLNSKLKKTLRKGQKLPKFRYRPGEKNKKTINIRKWKGKPLYVYFWNRKSNDFWRDTFWLSEINRLYGNRVNILIVNSGDLPSFVYDFNRLYEKNYNHGLSTRKINKKLKIENLPRGIYLNKRQRIQNVAITPLDFYLLLQNSEK